MRPFGHTDFDAAFSPGTVFRRPDGERMAVRQVEVGHLNLLTGDLVACDPTSLRFDGRPFTRSAPAGCHPVSLCLVDRGDVAAARVRFSSEKVATWEMALRRGEDPSTLPLGRFFGYGVDAGMGCFVESFELLEVPDGIYDDISAKLTHAREDWTDLPLGVRFDEDDPDTELNLIAFRSGYGDGAYPSYWGLDTAGEPVSLVTDFRLLVEYVEGTATFPLRDWIGKQLPHPDFDRLRVRVFLESCGKPQEPRLRLRVEGGRIEGTVTTGGREYSSRMAANQVIGVGSESVATTEFAFDEPVGPDATITLTYGMGTRSLEVVA